MKFGGARRLLGFVVFEEVACLFEVDQVSVDHELVCPCVVGDGDDTVNGMAALAENFDEKVDVYHGRESTLSLVRCASALGSIIFCG
jgi:hypothetical protein